MFILRQLALALLGTRFRIAVDDGVANEFIGHGQGDALDVIDTVGQIDTFDGSVLAVVEVRGNQFVFNPYRAFPE